MLIRKAFPPFYLFVIFSSGLAAALSFLFDSFSATWMAAVMLTTIPARQVLMPAINLATDSGLKKRPERTSRNGEIHQLDQRQAERVQSAYQAKPLAMTAMQLARACSQAMYRLNELLV